MEERQLKAIAVTGSLLSLAAIYVFVLNISPETIEICDISLEHVGRIVNVTGTAEDVLQRNNHVFFTLSEGGCEIRVVLWESVVEGLEIRGTDVAAITNNTVVNLAGEVDIHGGYLQIVPTRPTLSIAEKI
ncbi:MAG: hypothetical protein JSV63_01995 [Candidatus Aenigmatarchaeota archaeon]|nr:MAG: hypothetical protein JSV63_01995 [Candidatus Aenigmarchaeota archaeon]